MSAATSFASLLRTSRMSAGLTIQALAERSGVSIRAIGDIERGASATPQRRTVEALGAGLGLDAAGQEAFVRTARAQKRFALGALHRLAVAPDRLVDFTGRERELKQIIAVLDSAATPAYTARTVVVSGPPGLGKTTIALEALGRAQRTRPTVLFTDLDGLSLTPLTPLDVLRDLLRQMPDFGQKLPSTLDEAVGIWRAASGDNPPAVVLDNAANEAQIRPVLTMDARGVVVVTSRRSLAGLSGPSRVVLPPLSLDESVDLLELLIPKDDGNTDAVRELAALCGRVPLALRIAGNRIASLPSRTAADFVKRMRSSENRLDLLVDGDLGVETAFALSYDDLNRTTAALFCALSVIDGTTFDARLAAAIVGTDVLDTEDRLDELCDLGMLEARGGDRYRLHDLLRVYAATRLPVDFGGQTAGRYRTRLRLWLLGSLERAGAWFEPGRSPQETASTALTFPDSTAAMAWIRLEEQHWWPAMRSAPASGEHELITDVADSLHWFSELWIDWGNWTEFFSLAVEAARVLRDPRIEAMHLGYVVWSVILETGDLGKALDVANRALKAAEISGDHEQQGWAHFYVAWALQDMGRLDECVVSASTAIAEFGIAKKEDGATQAMIILGRAQTDRGDHDRAAKEYAAIIARVNANHVRGRDPVSIITLLTASSYMATSLLALNRLDEAMAAADMSVHAAHELKSDTRLASVLRRRALVHIALGDEKAAAADISMALAGLDAQSKDAYLVELRTKLEEIQDGLGGVLRPID